MRLTVSYRQPASTTQLYVFYYSNGLTCLLFPHGSPTKTFFGYLSVFILLYTTVRLYFSRSLWRFFILYTGYSWNVDVLSFSTLLFFYQVVSRSIAYNIIFPSRYKIIGFIFLNSDIIIAFIIWHESITFTFHLLLRWG